MGYSRLVSAELINFMSFKHAKIVFDETGVIAIKGYNDSGKSAILKGIMVCLNDINKASQKKWIHHGEDFFRIIVSFDDGVSIVKDKYMNGQGLYEMYKDDKLIYTTKQGTKLTRIDGVPESIRDYLGLCETSTGCLNYQSCTDKMLLIETTGGENYNELNTVLKAGEISKAQQMARFDLNQVNSRIEETDAELTSTKLSLEEYKPYSSGVVDVLEEKEEVLRQFEDRGELLSRMLSDIDGISKVKEIPEVDSIEDDKITEVGDVVNVFNKYQSVLVYPDVVRVNENRLEDYLEVIDTLKKLQRVQEIPEVKEVDVEREQLLSVIYPLVNKVSKTNVTPLISEVNKDLLDRESELLQVSERLMALKKYESHYRRIKGEIKEMSSSMGIIVEEAESKGIRIGICPNCGSMVGIGETHIH